ncbi:MAG: tripartite tricarboxylate transporter permease [Desulfovibrio sp.]|uniref:tripartite tricarboxylate transporter permease n=1 Tax=Desulfovibrio sp. TaxID=885 RepID=UPI002589EF6A|nr:tripartite tricarboxylate transporter permease [Desulfovibrio sp.]MCD7982893.1 tripartite tricarboxylate transporter permease [Desulfovibrio sp.]
MLADICTGLISVFTLPSIGAIALGILTGLIFGAIPGISGIMAISILLPMTFYVSPLVGIPMLLGIYKASMFGGSITAVLLNTPGAPPAVCTAMDGFPLTRQGKAGKALNAALTGSVFGDTFSNILLICVAAPLAYLTLKIGPVEQCCLILLALTVVGSISGASLTKGIICAGVGILLATVGASGATGAIRFTFDNENLMGGIALIPMVIGLLCLPEVIHQASSRISSVIQQKLNLKDENGRLTWKEFKAHIPVLLRSSLIGSIIGALPGLGASPAAYMAYSEARRTSKNPETFGKGNVAGVLAPEAANNAVTGSAMIPLLTLGIPGDDVTAVLMGAFLIQGITPGPNIFFDNTTVVYGIFASLIICDVLLYVIAKTGFRFWVRITQLPKHIIFSTVTIFAFVGTYSINQSLFDVLCLILFGLLGYGMRRFQFPAGPMIIGFILGPLLESAFDQTMTLSDGSFMIFLTKPVAVLLLLLTAGAVFSILRGRKRHARLLRQARA